MGASGAEVAPALGINPNVVHRWPQEFRFSETLWFFGGSDTMQA
jgi:transposase-like protein